MSETVIEGDKDWLRQFARRDGIMGLEPGAVSDTFEQEMMAVCEKHNVLVFGCAYLKAILPSGNAVAKSFLLEKFGTDSTLRHMYADSLGRGVREFVFRATGRKPD